MTNIIKVQFFKGGTPAGKAYSYYTPEPVDVGDIVDIKTNHGTARAMVVQADVPEAEVAGFQARRQDHHRQVGLPLRGLRRVHRYRGGRSHLRS